MTNQSHSARQDPNVYFVPNGSTWTEQGTTYTSTGWTADEITQAMDSLQQFANVANLNFTVTSDPNDATFTLGTYNIGNNILGYFYLPGNYAEAGTGAFDSSLGTWSPQSISSGGFSYALFLHEFGHGLGLEHPHADNFGDSTFPGVSSYSDTGDYALNQGAYTVMTYIDGWVSHPDGINVYASYDYGFSATPMALDIAVLQDMYGANTTYASGDNTYILPPSNGAGTSYSSIWDTGGVDTIISNATTDTTIDLRPATLQVEYGGGGYMSYTTQVAGGFTIAADVVIENAVGGSGNDALIGNAADNTLTGNAGNDMIGDSLGDDVMYGGDGHDALLNGSGVSALYGGDGNDLLLGGNQVDTLYGGNGNDALRGDHVGDIIGGSDKLYGGAGDDILMGGLGADEFIFAPNEGSDTIATFDATSHDPTMTPVVVTNGADFIQGLDAIVLSGFSGATTSDILANVTESNGNSVFTAEGTTITVFGVTGLTVDDFEII